MTTSQTDHRAGQRPLRLWPGVLAVTFQWLARFAVPEATIYRILAGVFGGGLAVLVWWLFFSRASGGTMSAALRRIIRRHGTGSLSCPPRPRSSPAPPRRRRP